MSAKIYLNLLLLYGVLCQGIVGTLSENDIDESSDLLVRQKRVINRAADVPESVRKVPYIVFIKEIINDSHCPGTILSNHIVLTVAKCVRLRDDAYRVYSGNSRLHLTGRYRTHSIIDKKSFNGVHRLRTDDGVSLIAVHPPFDFTATVMRSISFFEGYLRTGALVTVSGWGCDEGRNRGTEHPQHLRSITVPTISIQQCEDLYRGLFPITNADICTLDQTGQQYCTVNDAGAPLVVKVNRVPYLVGIHLWNGGVVGRVNPDVFINLQDHRYKTWIAENLRIMESNIHNLNPHIHG